MVQLELELATLELKRKLAALGLGIALLVGSALIGLFALGLAVAAAAAGLATLLPAWASLLLVAAGLFLLAGVLATVGIAGLKKGTPPVPELAMEEAKLTKEALKNGAP